jgi:signal transduction histidine kinase
MLQKEFRGGVLVITGSESAVGLRSMPARYLLLDEITGYPVDADGEGAPVELAEARQGQQRMALLEDRARIARDLHDRIGQSLAYLAFELDRLVTIAESGEPMGDRVERLRDDVRMVIREVRDTLYDLRTDVSDAQDLPQVLSQFAERVRERSELDITLVCDEADRLPLLQEREMWRIAQEAVTNVERHANASRVRLVWRCNGDSAVLDITDDGVYDVRTNY